MILIDMNMPRSCQDCLAFGTNACDKWDKHKTFSDQRTKRHNDCPLHEYTPIEVLQEIRQKIKKAVVDVLYHDGPDETTISTLIPEEVFGIIDRYIEQYKEDAE